MLFGLISVEEDGADDGTSSDCELKGEREVKYKDAGDAGDDDGEAAGESLEDVVGVLHHDGHKKTAERVLGDSEPDEGVVTMEKSTL